MRLDGEQLLRRLTALGEIGRGDRGGVARLALTDADREGRDVVVDWLRELDLDVTVDRIGNVIGLLPGRTDGPPVMIGSHIDSVRNGGTLDGTLGVLAGIEIVGAVREAGSAPARGIAVAFFTDEEGARFPPDMLGSLVYAGGMAVEAALEVRDGDGLRLGDELDRIGYAGSAPCPGVVPHAYVELHIEQGPVLEAEGIAVGAVTGVQGISWTEVVLEGQPNHAGTTPMSYRRDAGYVAAALTTFARDLTKELGPDLVATVGRLQLEPDLVNVVAGRALLTVDLRHPDAPTLADARARLAAELARLAEGEGVGVTTRTLADFDPVAFDEGIIAMVETAAAARGLSCRRLVSGAGHDAQMLARVCPAGMVFVPSHRGISHNPAEHTDDDDLVAGAEVLLDVVAELAGAAP